MSKIEKIIEAANLLGKVKEVLGFESAISFGSFISFRDFVPFPFGGLDYKDKNLKEEYKKYGLNLESSDPNFRSIIHEIHDKFLCAKEPELSDNEKEIQRLTKIIEEAKEKLNQLEN